MFIALVQVITSHGERFDFLETFWGGPAVDNAQRLRILLFTSRLHEQGCHFSGFWSEIPAEILVSGFWQNFRQKPETCLNYEITELVYAFNDEEENNVLQPTLMRPGV